MYETAASSPASVAQSAWPLGSSAMAVRIRAHDWAATPLGPVEAWPQTLRTVVDIVLASDLPMIAVWGPDLIRIYNDRFREVAGESSAAGLGQPLPEDASGSWVDHGLIRERVLAGETLSCEGNLIPRTRSGRPQDAWYTSSYAPLRDESGRVAGVLVTLVDTTEGILAERRQSEAEAALRSREARHQALLGAIEEGYWLAEVLFDAQSRPVDILFIEANPAAQRMIGQDLVGRRVSAIGAYDTQWFDAFGRVVRTGRAEQHEQYSAADDRWYEFNVFKPDPEDPASNRIAALYRDVTERRRTREARENLTRQLAEERTRLASLIENLPVGVCVVDLKGATVLSNPAFQRYRPDGSIPSSSPDTRGEWTAFDEQGRALPVSLYPGAQALRGEPVKGIEFLHRKPDGGESWTRVSGIPMHGPDGQLSGALTVIVDIDEIKRNQEHLRLLAHELNHRVKNTLATVQSIAAQTIRNAPTMAEAKSALEERLLALSRAHDVLTRENWDGAELREIATQAVAPYSNRHEDRLHLTGPTVRLPPRMALALAMVLQELATNALKYGALSNATGEVRISWEVNGASPGSLHLRWEESGGPPVEPPKRRGFGSRLIERSLAQDLNGTVRIHFAAGGVTCTVDAPIA